MSVFLLQDQVLTTQIQSNLRKNLKRNGLTVDIKNIHWTGWGSFHCSNVSVIDVREKIALATAEQMKIRFDLLSLLKNRRSPSKAIREVKIINPSLKLNRYSDGTWDIQKYFPKSNRKLQLNTVFNVKNGTLSLHDDRYGKHYLEQIDGKARFYSNYTLTWDCSGISDLNNNFQWSSRGNATTNLKNGQGEISVNNLLLSKIEPYLPEKYPIKVYKGVGKINLEFGWRPNGFWIDEGAVTLNNTRLKIPTVNEILDIKELDGTISPMELRINKAHLGYHGSSLIISGRLNTNTTAIEGVIDGEKVDLADLPRFIPQLQPYQIGGLANLRIELDGNLDQPILNGELILAGVGFELEDGLRIDRISGEAKIHKNDFEIKKLEGFVGEASVGVNGKINNLFAPVFDLNVIARDVNPNELTLPDLTGLTLGSKIDFKGKVNGELWSPLVTGELQINRLEYRELQGKNLKANFGWDVMSKEVHITKLVGDIWGGNFLVEGSVKINPKGVEWKVSGDIAELQLGQIKHLSEFDIDGQLSSNAILKGKWNPGDPFEPGLILGTFRGENFSSQGIFFKDIQGVYSWEQDKLLVDSIQARSGQGRIYGHLSWDAQIMMAAFNAEQIVISDLLPGVEQNPVDGIFNGTFEFKGPLSEIKGKIQCSLKQATYLSKPVGEITGILDYENQSLNIVDLHLAADSGDFNIKGGINWASEPAIDLTVNSFAAELDGFANWGPIDPSLQLGGMGSLDLKISGPLANPFYTGLINLKNPSIGSFQMQQGILQFKGDFQEISVDRMELWDSSSSILITGKAARDNLNLFLTCNGIILDDFGLNYKGNRLQGRIDLEGKLTGKPDNPVFTATIFSDDVAFGPFSGGIKSGDFVWKGQEIQLSRIRFNGEDFALNMYGKIDFSRSLELDLGINVDNLSLPKLVQTFNLSGIEVIGKVGGLVKITGAPSQPEIKIHGEFIDAALSSAPFQGEFELKYRQKTLDIEQIRIRQQLGDLTATGSWEADSRLNLKINATDFSLEILNSFLNPEHKLAGNIDIDSELALTKTNISGKLSANIDELYLNQIHLGDLQLRGKYTEQGLVIDESFLNAKGGRLKARGQLPWPDQLFSKMGFTNNSAENHHNLDLDLSFKNIPVAIIDSFIPGDIQVSSGAMDGGLGVKGTYRKPFITGKLEASNIGVTTPLLPLPIENAQASMEIVNNRVLIEKTRGRYGEGKFTLHGEAIIFGKEAPLHFNLKFRGSDLYYRNNYFDGFTDLNIQLTGVPDDSKLTGTVHVFKSKIGVLRIIKKTPSNVKWNPEFNLRVTTGKNVRYRQVGLADITLHSNLRITGDYKNPSISGEAVSNKGVLTLYGQTFRINEAKAIFDDSHGIKPYVDVDSSIKTAKNEVFLIVRGQIGEDLSINLYSYPSLSQEELFALLNWSELRGDKPFNVQEVADTNLSFITDTMFGEVFYELRRALHLDYLYLERDYLLDEFRISAGEFVSDNLFLLYSRSVSEEPNEKWGLDYQLTSNLTAGGTYSIEEGASWRVTYRFRF
jgi:autotransporter translocation and assembly factor TamB